MNVQPQIKPVANSTSKLKFYNLSCRFSHGMPEWPTVPGISLMPMHHHANQGIQVTEWEGVMHRGTHMDSPLHVTENTPSIIDYPLWRFFGTGVAVSIPKKKWEIVTAEDLEKATPTIRENDIVMINTGWHHTFGDNDDYYAYSPGMYKDAAEWLVAKKVKMVGIDVQALDHPLGTKLVDHGPGPSHPHLMEEYRKETGRDVMKDFPHWEVAHKTLMVKGGIPGIENISGDIDAITGKRCTFMAFPWRWDGDGCGVRVVAVIDPDQTFRIESGR